MFRKAVLPAAGRGTRLLPITKELPKEMLPIFASGNGGKIFLKPMMQAVFEQLYDVGVREFCFIVGREKRAIEDHFTPDGNFVSYLEEKNKVELAGELRGFYDALERSKIMFINQPEPKGFGDAVLRTKPFMTRDFLVHAGDAYIVSPNHEHLRRLMKVHSELRADLTFVIQEVENPKQYGVVEAEECGDGIYRVRRAIEKPEKPATNLAIMPIYIFTPAIFGALKEIKPGIAGELQLTDGIQRMVDSGSKVCAMKLKKGEIRLDIGTPDLWWESVSFSFGHSL